MILTYDKTLMYYDFPQLFSAKSEDGKYFICMCYSDENDIEYIAVLVSDGLLEKIKNSEIDLRTVFLNPENGEWYFVTVNNRSVVAEVSNIGLIEEKYLPAQGLYLTPNDFI